MKITSRLWDERLRGNSNFYSFCVICVLKRSRTNRARSKKVFLCLHYAVRDVVSARLGYPPGNNIVFCWFSVFDFSRPIWFDCFFPLALRYFVFFIPPRLTLLVDSVYIHFFVIISPMFSFLFFGILFYIHYVNEKKYSFQHTTIKRETRRRQIFFNKKYKFVYEKLFKVNLTFAPFEKYFSNLIYSYDRKRRGVGPKIKKGEKPFFVERETREKSAFKFSFNGYAISLYFRIVLYFSSKGFTIKSKHRKRHNFKITEKCYSFSLLFFVSFFSLLCARTLRCFFSSSLFLTLKKISATRNDVPSIEIQFGNVNRSRFAIFIRTCRKRSQQRTMFA